MYTPGATSSPRSCSGWRWPAVVAAATTFIAAVVLDVVAGASVWHVLSLGALSGVVGLLRLRWPERRHRVAATMASAILVAQPALHLAGQLSERPIAESQPGQGAAHDGLLALHLVLAAATAIVVAVSDVLVLAMAEVLLRLVQMLAVLLPAAPEHRLPRPFTSIPGIAGRFPAWVAYAVRRGPPQLELLI